MVTGAAGLRPAANYPCRSSGKAAIFGQEIIEVNKNIDFIIFIDYQGLRLQSPP
jgi:hypothetical protein